MGNLRTCMVLIALLAACGDDELLPPPPDAATSVSEEVGEEGGTVELGEELALDIPPGALDGDTMITIEVSDETPPGNALGPVYELGPDGLVFAHPITVRLAMPEGVTDADVYWSQDGTTFDNVGGEFDDGVVTTQAVHFTGMYGGEAGTTRTVTGSQVVTWVSASGFQNIPNDLSTFPVAALVEDGAGGYTTFDGVGNASGTFTIPDVPNGFYWLRVPGRDGGVAFARTDEFAIDAGFSRQGRPDAVELTTQTDLVLELGNLETWQDGDQLELFSTEAFAWYFNAELGGGAGSPAPGATSLTGFTFNLASDYVATPHLIEGDRAPPDRFVIAQLSGRTAGTVPYLAMSRLLEPAPFTVTAGVTTTITDELVDVSTANTITLDVQMDEIRAAFAEEARPCASPPGWPTSWPIYVLGVAGGLDHGVSGNTADFLVLYLANDAPDTLAQDMGFGVPLAGTWGVYGSARFGSVCSLALPGTTGQPAIVGAAGMTIEEPLVTIGAGPVRPRLGQVRAPLIAGSSLFAEQTGFGLTPGLSWTAPSIGTPSFYEVGVTHLSLDAGDTVGELVAVLLTDQTSLTLPPGLLVAGEAYAFRIAARVSSRPDPSALQREVLPEYTSGVASAIQRP